MSFEENNINTPSPYIPSLKESYQYLKVTLFASEKCMKALRVPFYWYFQLDNSADSNKWRFGWNISEGPIKGGSDFVYVLNQEETSDLLIFKKSVFDLMVEHKIDERLNLIYVPVMFGSILGG